MNLNKNTTAMLEQLVFINHSFASHAIARINELESENQALKSQNDDYSKTNYKLWMGIFLAFLLGFWIRSQI